MTSEPKDGQTSADRYRWSETGHLIWQDRTLDMAVWQFAAPVGDKPEGVQPALLTPVQAVRALASTAGPAGLRHLVVGVIGPRAATPQQESLAEELGQALAGLGVTVICGGRGGVMAAVSAGVARAGGLCLGLLPGNDPAEANPHVAIPLPTGLGEGRNMVIARAARVLVAVGSSHGTITEMAYGLHFGKTVLVLDQAPDIPGLNPVDSVADAVAGCCRALLRQAWPDTDARGPAS